MGADDELDRRSSVVYEILDMVTPDDVEPFFEADARSSLPDETHGDQVQSFPFLRIGHDPLASARSGSRKLHPPMVTRSKIRPGMQPNEIHDKLLACILGAGCQCHSIVDGLEIHGAFVIPSVRHIDKAMSLIKGSRKGSEIPGIPRANSPELRDYGAGTQAPEPVATEPYGGVSWVDADEERRGDRMIAGPRHGRPRRRLRELREIFRTREIRLGVEYPRSEAGRTGFEKLSGDRRHLLTRLVHGRHVAGPCSALRLPKYTRKRSRGGFCFSRRRFSFGACIL